LSEDNDVLRYIVKDDPLGEEESIGHDWDGTLANLLKERSNPLNHNRYIHNKFMLVDPLLRRFMRVFEHYYARYLVRVLTDDGRLDPEANYLKDKISDWLPPHLNPEATRQSAGNTLRPWRSNAGTPFGAIDESKA
jgi:hypothetical protein